MTAHQTRSKSYFGTACLYAAGYLSIAAIALFCYQLLLWSRTGAWVSHQMWLVLDWAGWQHPPAIAWGRPQFFLDRIWDMAGNCPIGIALTLLALLAAGLACANGCFTPRVPESRMARGPLF